LPFECALPFERVCFSRPTINNILTRPRKFPNVKIFVWYNEGLTPGATYYVGIRADASASDTTSNYSLALKVVMPELSQSGTVGLSRYRDKAATCNTGWPN
ncbi:MAG: hypothetical protein FWD31_03710, partial [Planctomycetaceae bacterium]|nr:hypothetical protein [Planctomycetaceae bacterium]